MQRLLRVQLRVCLRVSRGLRARVAVHLVQYRAHRVQWLALRRVVRAVRRMHRVVRQVRALWRLEAEEALADQVHLAWVRAAGHCGRACLRV